jgi:hypothetical protein
LKTSDFAVTTGKRIMLQNINIAFISELKMVDKNTYLIKRIILLFLADRSGRAV